MGPAHQPAAVASQVKSRSTRSREAVELFGVAEVNSMMGANGIADSSSDHVFGDGSESGSTAAWSMTVGG